MSLIWKKLLSNPPTAWQRLSLITRGIGNEVLRVLDDNGEIDCGTEDPTSVVCRITGAHPKERRRVREAAHELVDEGFLSIDSVDGRSVIRGHLPDLAMARKKATTRAGTRPERARSEAGACAEDARTETGACADGASSVPTDAGKPAQLFNTRPVEERREEEKREEEKRGAAPEAPPRPPDEVRIEELSRRYPAALLEQVLAACRSHRTTGRMAPSVWRSTLDRLAVFELEVAVRALQTFADKYGDGSKDEAYLIGIARGERDREVQRPLRFARGDLGRPVTNEQLPDGWDVWDPNEARPT